MIDFIEGKLVEKSPSHAIMACNGLGYKVHISLTTFSNIEIEDQCKLHTHYHVSVDVRSGASNHTLYGFHTLGERGLFRELISVSGVSSNLAMVILSSKNPSELQAAIVQGNIASFKSIKGIGPKLAQRIVMDLQAKFQKLGDLPEIPMVSNNTIENEALSALCSLGFDKSKAEITIQNVMKDSGVELRVEELIKESLKAL
ncbi:MAG: Holliday junction branch migration protein RuvA [Bacteroidota bacterium]